MMNRRTLALAAAVLLGATACSDDGGSKSIGLSPTLEIQEAGRSVGHKSTLSIAPGGLEVGETAMVAELFLINTGNKVLEIDGLHVTPEAAFSLASKPDGTALDPFPLFIDPQDSLDGLNPRSRVVYLLYTRQAGDTPPTGKITVESDSVIGGVQLSEMEVFIEVGGSSPRLQVVPAQVDFGNVGLNDPKQKPLSLLNQGNSPLVISRFRLSGHPAYTLAVGADQFPVSIDTAQGMTLDPPLEVAPGSSQNVAILFSPSGPEPAQAELILFSNDPLQLSGTVIPLGGNVGGPCIAVNPKKVDFGGKLVGRPATVDVEITSCGDQPLEINEIALMADASGDFALDIQALPGVGAVPPVRALGPADPPVILAPNATGTFQVVFTPDEINPLGSDDRPIPDVGQILIRSNAFVSEFEVDVSGFGVEVECPTAVISVREGEEVIPQTKLHLIGSQSYASTGRIEEYRWEVQQPVGSQSVFVPLQTAPDPTFEVNVAGTYVFKLTVIDAEGTPSCIAAEVSVLVSPNEAIHIELLWDTPEDHDQTDEGPVAGADLDLHFAHPFAIGEFDGDRDGIGDPWFIVPWDTFWYNRHPNWGNLEESVDDNPGLDRDDTDGAGPENINLSLPEDGKEYRLGVHYWNDHGFGVSFATLRVYIYSNLVFEMERVRLFNHDMWWAATIPWPSARVNLWRVCQNTTTACETDEQCGDGVACGLRITPGYVHPFFPAE